MNGMVWYGMVFGMVLGMVLGMVYNNNLAMTKIKNEGI